ncbi:MAG: hypothetical protein LBE22_06210 [Azoarcus sp.]|jgi:hypothetical protein|nr:hypothetical protein [Azoarcus sp.]
MSNGTIEILGQRFSYPTSWHGTAAVLAVCVSLVVVVFVVKDWATPEVLDKLRGIADYSEEQDETTKDLVETVAKLTAQINELEGRVPQESATGSNAAESNKVKIGRLQREIDISKLRERLATQNLLRPRPISPSTDSTIDSSKRIQSYQQQQLRQQQLQQALSTELQQLQVEP